MLTEEELLKICHDCGLVKNTKCLLGPNSVPVCTCKPGYRGNASVSCEGNFVSLNLNNAIEILTFFLL